MSLLNKAQEKAKASEQRATPVRTYIPDRQQMPAQEKICGQTPVGENKPRDANELLEIIEHIANIKDLDSLLERILWEARHFVNADAGTIYLTSGDYLYFNYVQNDTLFQEESAKDKYISSSMRVEINKNSLAGYVAVTGESLLIDDVYDIRSDVSYSFNASVDTKTSYRTHSILVVPLKTADEVVLGVLQLINAKDGRGQVVPFSMQDRIYISQFAQNAAHAIEKAKLSRELVFRMIDMTELRDPYETTNHAKRVGAYSIEMYQRWAETHGVSVREIKNTKDYLWTAGVLHDVGKIALSDVILQKKGGLTYEERTHVRYHTIYGARLFRYTHSPWDRMAAEVALNHHERWDGQGYPGKIEDIYGEKVFLGPGKKGKEIPLVARIVAIADVYDSLISKRAYKEPWKEENAIKHVHMQSGKHFDPELVDLFISLYDVILAIRNKFPSDTRI
ncbi:MAG TPA: HD domain-containing phosphohydrolase [Spirochaetia bacterium]|nr:HD domain-containing phosphohydrolase [Spirochaetia bacterium]